jgi:hypothetical protein
MKIAGVGGRKKNLKWREHEGRGYWRDNKWVEWKRFQLIEKAWQAAGLFLSRFALAKAVRF